jgi:hypothetical protein
MLRNNVFTNPIGWARALVRTRRRYRVVSTASAALGLSLIVLLHLRGVGVWIAVGASILAFIGCVELPLYYLRALRAFVQKEEQRASVRGIHAEVSRTG